MANVFDSANYPTKEPTELIAGDRWQWKLEGLDTDYPTADYTLTYSLRLEGGDPSDEITITASESGGDYIVEVAAATTALYKPGRYQWQRFITRASDSARATLARGVVEVKPDLNTDTSDPRSTARKMLALYEAAAEAFASGVLSYNIGDRSVSYNQRFLDDLEYWRKRVAAEDRAEKLANGNGNKSNYFARFVR